MEEGEGETEAMKKERIEEEEGKCSGREEKQVVRGDRSIKRERGGERN